MEWVTFLAGLAAWAARRSTGATQEFLPNVAKAVAWLSVLLAALATIGTVTGSLLPEHAGQLAAVWGTMQVLMWVYLEGCRRGKTGHPW